MNREQNFVIPQWYYIEKYHKVWILCALFFDENQFTQLSFPKSYRFIEAPDLKTLYNNKFGVSFILNVEAFKDSHFPHCLKTKSKQLGD